MMSLSMADISARYSLSVTGIRAARSSSKNWKNMGGGFLQANGDLWSLARLGRSGQRDGKGGRDLVGRGNDRPLRRHLGDVHQGFRIDGVEEVTQLFVVARRREFNRGLDRPGADGAGGEHDPVVQRLERRSFVG